MSSYKINDLPYDDSFKRFMRFLKDNNAYYTFVYDWYRIKFKRKHIDDLILRSSEKLYLGLAFCWALSTKNRDFWVRLNRKWMIEYCGLALQQYNNLQYEPELKKYEKD